MNRLCARLFVVLIGVWALVAAAGCARLEVGPLVRAGEPVRSGLVQAGEIVASDLALLASVDELTAEQTADLQGWADELRSMWAPRLAAGQAIADYAQALADLAESGRGGRQAIAELAAAVDGLLTTLSAPAMPAGYVQLAASLYGIYAQVQASRSIADALAAADGAVQALSVVLERDLDDLDAILAASALELERRLREPHAQLISHRMNLERTRSLLESRSAQLAGQFAPLASEMSAVTTLIDATRDRYEPLMQRIAAGHSRIASHRHLLRQLRQSISDFAAAHRRLAQPRTSSPSPPEHQP
jgi:hypothetical protein